MPPLKLRRHAVPYGAIMSSPAASAMTDVGSGTAAAKNMQVTGTVQFEGRSVLALNGCDFNMIHSQHRILCIDTSEVT